MKPPEVVVKIDPDADDGATSSIGTPRATAARPEHHHDRESSFDFDARPGDVSSTAGRPSHSRGGSEDFSFQRKNSVGGTSEDPPSRLIGQFLEQQKAAGEMSLDMDLEMEELRQDTRRTAGLPPLPRERLKHNQSFNRRVPSQAPSPTSQSANSNIFNEGGSREFLRVSFKEQQPPEQTRRRSTAYNDLGQASSSDSDDTDDVADDSAAEISAAMDDRRTVGPQSRRFQSYRDNAEVIRCTSNAAFGRAPTLTRTKTSNRSRMMDPPPVEEPSGQVSAKSGQVRSGFMGKTGLGGDEEDDDPFIEDDLPNDLKKEPISTLVVLEWVSLVLIIGALICSLVIPVLRKTTLWRLMLWKWEVLVLVLICGRLVSGWLIRFMVFSIERNFMLRKRVLYFVYGLRKAVRNCIWLGLVLLTWHFLFDKKVANQAHTIILDYVTKILVCFLVSAVIWLVKTLIVKVLASSFHVNAFFDRIQESLFNQFVIETLSGPPFYELQRNGEEEDRTIAEIQTLQNAGAMVPPELKANVLPRTRSTKSVVNAHSSKSPIGQSMKLSGPLCNKKHEDKGITLDHLHKLNQRNVSAWNMKRLMNIVRRGALTTLDEHLDSKKVDESTTQIKSEVEAKTAAKKIYHNVARPGARFIYLEDLLRFMHEDEALKTLSLFEGALESEMISKAALKNWVVNAFRERKALSLTLNDTKSAVTKLHHMVNILVIVLLCLIWLIILNIATSQFLVFASSQVVLVAFVFGNSCKNIFESIIFIFVVHPYDVGDRTEIDGVQMVVEEMNILTTVFLRYDNQKIIYPNSMLLMKPISNYYRSPDMGDAVEFCCHIVTPSEKITLARQRILSYIENKKEHWHPNPMIILKDIESFATLRIAIWLQHRMNHQDMGERWGRRALLVEECVKIFRELDIEYRILPWNINVRTMPPLNFNSAPSNWPSNQPPPNFASGMPETDREIVHR